MKKLLIAASALLALTSYAFAAGESLQQFQNEVAGYSCGGSTCTLSVTNAQTNTNVTTVNHSSGGVHFSECGAFEDAIPMPGDHVFCVAHVTDMFSPGPTITTSTAYSCTTTSKKVKFNPNKKPSKQWSTKTSTSTVNGAC